MLGMASMVRGCRAPPPCLGFPRHTSSIPALPAGAPANTRRFGTSRGSWGSPARPVRGSRRYGTSPLGVLVKVSGASSGRRWPARCQAGDEGRCGASIQPDGDVSGLGSLNRTCCRKSLHAQRKMAHPPRSSAGTQNALVLLTTVQLKGKTPLGMRVRLPVRFGARHLNQRRGVRSPSPVTKGVFVEMLAATGTPAAPTCTCVRDGGRGLSPLSCHAMNRCAASVPSI